MLGKASECGQHAGHGAFVITCPTPVEPSVLMFGSKGSIVMPSTGTVS